MLKCAILDDYQGAATTFGDWSRVSDRLEVTTFRQHLGGRDQVVKALAGFDIVVAMRERTPFDRKTLQALGGLSLLVTTGLHNAVIDVGAAKEFGITVCGTPGDHNSTVELTWALILAAARNLVDEHNSVRVGGWQVSIGQSLRKRRLAVVGLGRIGSEVARLGIAFGMDVQAWSPRITQKRCDDVGVSMAPSLMALCREADVLTLHLALGETTIGILTADHLRSLPRNAILVNAARAHLIDEAALMTALEERWFRSAALDVYYVEPLPADHQLRQMNHVLTTPHVGYVADRGYARYFEGAVTAIEAWLRGAPLNVLGSTASPAPET